MKTTPPARTTPKIAATRLTPSREEISAKAEALWRQRGCPQGRDDEFWLEAEKALANTQPKFNDDAVTEDLDALFPDEDRSSPTAL